MSQEKPIKAVAAIVAAGRTISDGKKKFSPGDTVMLAADEADRLRRIGFLVDDNATPVPVADGPTFNVKAGPSVKVA